MTQFIFMFNRIFLECDIDCYMKPYTALSTGERRGAVECVPNASPLSNGRNKLLSFYTAKFGQIGTPGFVNAQQAFIQSLPPYALLVHVFHCNIGELVVDENGHIVGTGINVLPQSKLFRTSGIALGWWQMLEMLGGSDASREFAQMREMYAKCFLAVRARYREVEAVLRQMEKAGISCIRQNSMVERLRERLFLDLSGKALIDAIYRSFNCIRWIYV